MEKRTRRRLRVRAGRRLGGRRDSPEGQNRVAGAHLALHGGLIVVYEDIPEEMQRTQRVPGKRMEEQEE